MGKERMNGTERVAVEEGTKEYESDLMTGMSKNANEEIKEESPIKVETTVPETVNGVIANAIHVKVRKTLRPDSEVVELLRVGDRVTIHRKVENCYEISTSVNKHVYIRSIFVRKESKKEG